LKVLDLFSGIGGFSLGLERAGMKTIAFCEIEEFPRKVLRKHWPDVPIFNDVRELHAEDITGTVDLICGGFPCQDLSCAGKQKGFEGERSSLYVEMLRLISECRPKYAVFENVTALLSGNGGAWFAQFLYDLAEVGCDAEWHCIPASYLGAVHRRDRVWIIAYPNGANVESLDLQKSLRTYTQKPFGWELTRTTDACLRADDYAVMRGKYDGVRETMDMLKALGNSVVPQIPELIGRAIMEIDR
jgi:DNA (cytosine-5)-methyltransferase 1